MKYFNLKDNSYVEIDESNTGLSFLYYNPIGRCFLRLAISKFVTNIYASYMKSSLSKHKIKKFIKNNNINMDEYQKENYKCFNDFFMRNIKSENRPIESDLYAIADSKLSVYNITDDLVLNIKNSKYTIEELVQDEYLANKYKNGIALVYRLCVDDYHHYLFPDSGKIVSNKYIKGKFHTVRPIALKREKVFSENAREVTVLNTDNCGVVTTIEVGALMVGKIVNENVKEFKKGQEKGHFEFGGSTVVVLYENNKIVLNKKLFEITNNDEEIIVKMGNNLK